MCVTPRVAGSRQSLPVQEHTVCHNLPAAAWSFSRCVSSSETRLDRRACFETERFPPPKKYVMDVEENVGFDAWVLLRTKPVSALLPVDQPFLAHRKTIHDLQRAILLKGKFSSCYCALLHTQLLTSTYRNPTLLNLRQAALYTRLSATKATT